MEMIPKVLQAVAGEDFVVYVYFHDGSIRLFDAKPLLNAGGVFTPLRDPVFFRERLTVLNDSVAWDMDGTLNLSTCVDLDPCELYETSPAITDPLQDAM